MKNKKANTHGVISLLIVFTSFILGIVAIIPYSYVMAFISLFLVVLAFFCVSFLYCSKCTCREKCNHILIGKLSVLLIEKKAGKYSLSDLILGVMLPFGIAIAFPQYWLIQNLPLFILYWSLLLIALIEITMLVCNNCKNDKCSLCRSCGRK